MKKLTKILFSLLALTILLPGSVSAGVNDFTVTNFEADYYLSSDSEHGSLTVAEKINVDFSDQNHGILRAIPEKYNSHPLNLKVLSVKNPLTGENWPYETYNENGHKVIKIGDPNKTVTGNQAYVINYQVENVISFYEDYDELFWNVNGDQWQQPFNSVIARLHIPAELATNFNSKIRCEAGYLGDTSQNCQITSVDNKDGVVVTATAINLLPQQTLSLVAAFNQGTFTPYTWQDRINEYKKDIVFGLFALAGLSFAFSRWWKFGRDFNGLGVIVPQYTPPKKLTVAEAGVLQDYNFDGKDVTAVIIDAAIKGYIKVIEETTKKFGLFKSTTTSLQVSSSDWSKMDSYQNRVLTAFFDNVVTPGTVKKLGTYNSSLYKVIKDVGSDISDKLIKEEMFERTPSKGGNAGVGGTLAVIIALLVVAFIAKAFIGVAVLVLVLIGVIILLSLMPRRSKQGEITNEQLKGLKLFITTTQKDRLKFMQSPSAPYSKNFKEPKRTVELFEKLLPFAIIFGVEKGWAKQFDSIYQQPPDWYSGNWRSFNTAVLASHISSSAQSISTSFSPPSSSGGSSGFSGGGAGGGGGGGGGGGW